MWVARDEDGTLNLFTHCPNTKLYGEWVVDVTDLIHNGAKYMSIDNKLFPNLKCEDEPIEVDIYESDLIKKYEELKDAYDALHMKYLSQVSLYKSLYEEEKKKNDKCDFD